MLSASLDVDLIHLLGLLMQFTHSQA